MVKEYIAQEGKTSYECEACGYRYPTRELAEQCEEWCRTHQSCNLEITAKGTPPESL